MVLRFRAVAAMAVAAGLLLSHPTAAKAAPAAGGQPIVIHKNEFASARGKDKSALLLERARERGRVRVIIGLDTEMEFEDDITPAKQRSQSQALRNAQAAVTARAGIPAEHVERLDTIPFMSGFVTASQLERLLRDPRVTSIQEDLPIELQLQDSLRIINATKVWSKEGYVGSGVVIAVLDSGAEYSHPMLKGKVVAGLCRSTTSTSEGTTSLCPGGVAASNDIDSGRNCTKSAACFHGTHVSSIALGSSATLLRGVARGARLISAQVLSGTSDGRLVGFFSDINSALERVFRLRKTYNIASVNVSLGGTLFGSACDESFPATTAIIGKLFKARIATVIASGNDGANGTISAPACIDKAIAVGSTRKDDVVSGFSNHAALVDLMAPGESIKAADLGGGLTSASGTSMAAPHVTGAIALLKDAKPDARVSQVLKALNDGASVRRNGITKPRIDSLKAVRLLAGGS